MKSPLPPSTARESHESLADFCSPLNEHGNERKYVCAQAKRELESTHNGVQSPRSFKDTNETATKRGGPRKQYVRMLKTYQNFKIKAFSRIFYVMSCCF